MATAADAQRTLTGYQKQQTAEQKRINNIRVKKANLKKPSKKDIKGLAKYNANIRMYDEQIKAGETKLGQIKERVATAQNTYYTASGQYEKLLKGTERDAYLAINALFKNYNLESLAPKIFDYVKNGYSADTITVLLQDTKEYKQRFAGNEARKKAGLPVLNPGEYLATEASYKQIMQTAGMPIGFYDSPSDFSSWIGKNVSPSEIQTRVDLATQATVLSNPAYRKALNSMGISDNELTAYFLDQNRALPHLQKSAATAAVGAEALKQGLSFDKAYSEQLALSGIGADEARQGYSTIASELDTYRALGAIYGEEYNQRTAEQATFEGQAGALQKKGRLLSAERGQFGGAAGGARAGLAQSGGNR